MGSKSTNYDEELSNGESTKGNDSSLIVNVNDTHSDIEHEESNYSQSDNENNHDNSSDSKMKDSGKKSKKEDSSHGKKSPAKDPKSRSKIDLSKTRYLWVSGIPIGTKTNQLEELFSEYGKVLAIKIIRGSGMSLLGFVKLETVEQAQKCMEKLNKTDFRGNKIELFKERPVEKDEKKMEKIGFRDSRKFIFKPPIPLKRVPFRPSRGHFRGSSKPIPSRIPPPRVNTHDIRRQEREEALRLEREKQKLKLERMKLERDKAELLKLERESRYERERGHEDKRIRSMVKRPFEDSFMEEKRYDDYNRRDDFAVRRYDSRSSPERKMNTRSFASISSRGRYDDNARQDRYSDAKYDSSKSWQMSDNSWMSTGGDRWNSSSYDTPRMISSISSNSISRLHSSADLSQNISSRNYFNNRRY